MKIDIPKDFSRHPAGRYIEDGPYNGELFRREFLEKPLRRHEMIEVKLDGARGYGSSFLEEAFGGLTRMGFSPEEILKYLIIKTSNPVLMRQITNYIRDGLSRESKKHNARNTPTSQQASR
ncbi:STAS-like domain-containing protein [Stutzerimonas nitrititolerans]|uniref:STAS-like domain-containing protein n=1 Tax=Stutzerimonas nitrititolerans TaxID=2482751 RepID=UPI0014829058|nr:STAS-like domain-containing protein [Stutzerimonas nitrititolerans]NNT92278.1 STAS-like domain-containing protein [Stutzerimonas nitrititolerans]